ncbi:MAG: CHAT domain-containing protein [Terriglobales bacterium]|jgi:CHAT domain-containing protein
MLVGQQRGAIRSGHIVRPELAMGTSLLLVCVLACSRHDNPQAVYDRASKALLHGDLKQAQDEAHRECQWFSSNSDWAWKFRTLEARAEIHQGLYADGLRLLRSVPLPPNRPDLVIPVLTLAGAANVYMQDFPEAEGSLNDAAKLCGISAWASCGYVSLVRGNLATELNQPESAERFYESSLAFARSHGDSFLESDSLLDLGNESLAEGRFDEAIDRSEAAFQIAKAIDARRLEPAAEGNIGWAYYKLGDLSKALGLFLEAGKLASELGDFDDQGAWLMDAAYVYMGVGKVELAAQSLREALGIEQHINSNENVYNALRALARLSLMKGDLANASQYSQQALESAQKRGNHLDELYPMLLQGQIAGRRGNTAEAEMTFLQVEHDKICPVFLKWEAEHSLAQLYEDEQHPDAADDEYRTALATFEAARDDVRHEDSQISFLTNAASVYDDYVHFLVASKKTDDALRWADFSRARTLNEGLGLVPKGGSEGPPPLDARQIARSAGGTLLFYWLGKKQSYLWAITPQKTTLFTLPPGKEIDDAVQRYREALKVQDVLASADRDGESLYQTLVGPARELLKKDAKVFVIPDGSLNNLNFETLLVSRPMLSEPNAPEPKVHYWIEDVTIANASSLRVLAAVRAGKQKRDRTLLIVGDSVAPNDEYRELPLAGAQMKSVESHFSAAKKILTRENATPSAYLASSPEQFSYIHFVAHGTASQLSPLDSAIVLSKDNSQDNSFKLYARDIIHERLRADLVTISACYSAGERSYSGEGLVGLSWAFLRAGAHNVVAALWDVSDASTVQLMDKFYDELNKGASPDAALRTAKLSLLRGREFHNPFYWAPFQLYARLG